MLWDNENKQRILQAENGRLHLNKSIFIITILKIDKAALLISSRIYPIR